MNDINVIVHNDHFRSSDRDLFFGEDDVQQVDPQTTFWNLLVMFRFFQSTSQAKGAWLPTGDPARVQRFPYRQEPPSPHHFEPDRIGLQRKRGMLR